MVRVAIIGCGGMGSNHLGCYLRIKDVKVVAVASKNLQDYVKDMIQGKDIHVYEDGDALLTNEKNLDIVDVCTPTYLHAEYAIKAMDAGVRYIMVEKPLVRTVEQGQALLNKAKETNTQLQTALVLRFESPYLVLNRYFETNVLGKLHHLNMRRLSLRPDWGWENWFQNPRLSGGAGLDLHIHDIDFCLYTFGKPKSVMTVKNEVGEDNSFVSSFLQYDGFTAAVEGSWDMPHDYGFIGDFRAAFDKGTLVYNKEGLFLINDEGKIKLPYPASDTYGEEVTELRENDAYLSEICLLISRFRKQAPVKFATLADGLEAVKFCLGECGETQYDIITS